MRRFWPFVQLKPERPLQQRPWNAASPIRQGTPGNACLAAIPLARAWRLCAPPKGLTATVADGAVRIPTAELAVAWA